MLIPLCGRSICIYLLENKQLQILLPRLRDQNDRDCRFFHSFSERGEFASWLPSFVRLIVTDIFAGHREYLECSLSAPKGRPNTAQASLEASLMMPESWPFTTGIYVLGTEGALAYAFRVGANIQEREQASHFFRLYKNDGTVSEPAA
jgi:hypothetical protein